MVYVIKACVCEGGQPVVPPPSPAGSSQLRRGSESDNIYRDQMLTTVIKGTCTKY